MPVIHKYSIEILKPDWPKWKIKFVDFFLLNLPVLRFKRINQLLKKYGHLRDVDFVKSSCAELGIVINSINYEAIPAEGAVTIAANHPGGADVLALIKTIGHKRRDMAILANSLVCVEPVDHIVIPVDKLSRKTKKVDYNQIDQAYQDGKAVVFFAAGMNSRPDEEGKLVDRRWRITFIQYALKYNTPLILMYIDKGNTPLFFKAARIRERYKFLKKVPLENFFQLREFIKAKGEVNVLVSNLISNKKIETLAQNRDIKEVRVIADKMHDFVYNMEKGEKEFNA